MRSVKKYINIWDCLRHSASKTPQTNVLCRLQRTRVSSSGGWIQRLHSAWPRSLGTAAQSGAVPRAEEPPCFPPILHSNEDQRREYQALNQPQVHFTCFDESPLMCRALQAQGIVLPGPYQHSSEDTVNKTTWAVADRWRPDRGRQHLSVWACDILREQGAGLFVRSWSHAVICHGACWTLSCCSGGCFFSIWLAAVFSKGKIAIESGAGSFSCQYCITTEGRVSHCLFVIFPICWVAGWFVSSPVIFLQPLRHESLLWGLKLSFYFLSIKTNTTPIVCCLWLHLFTYHVKNTWNRPLE